MENGGNPAFSIFNFQFSIRLAKRGAPTPCSHHISETISSPFRGAFHLSLTVLSAIDLCTYLALDGGPPRFRPDFTCPILLRILLDFYFLFTYGTITLYGGFFQRPLIKK